MFHVRDVAQLGEHEQVLAIVRKHVVTLLPMLCLSALLIVVPFFFLFSLLRGGIFGIVVFILVVAMGLFVALRTLHLWDADVLVVTTTRIIDVDQHGLWSRVVAEVPLTHLQDIRWERAGFVETVFRMGALRLTTSSAHAHVTVPRVAHPERLQALLQELRHKHGHDAVQTSPPAVSHEQTLSRREQIQLLLSRANEATLEEVQTLLEKRADRS